MTALAWHSLLALGAGILLNAAPCVLPVIPFKVQAVMRDIGQAWPQRIGAAAAMLAGSLSFFLILGGATIFLGLAWGAMFQSKIFIFLLSLFLLAAGLVTLLGWSLPLPQRVYDIKGRRYVGAALTGLFTGILATPCGGPFLGAVLAYALTQPALVTLVVFLSIGTGLVLPYMVLLTWPWLGRNLANSGAWTVQIKQILGFVIIAGAIFFVQSLVGPVIGRILWILFPVVLMIWSLAQLRAQQGWGMRTLPLLVGMVCIGAIANRLIASPGPELNWQVYSQQAIHQALQRGQPVMLEFTAEWCLNCKVLEKTTYTDQRVVNAARKAGIVSLRVDLTQMEDSKKKMMLRYGGRALPYLVLLDGQGKVHHAFTGLFGANTLTEALEALPKGAKSPTDRSRIERYPKHLAQKPFHNLHLDHNQSVLKTGLEGKNSIGECRYTAG